MWGHVRVHIFNQPINDEPSKSLGIKAKSMWRGVVLLVNIFNCLVYDWTVKDKWKVTWHDPKLVLDVSVSQKKIIKEDTKNI